MKSWQPGKKTWMLKWSLLLNLWIQKFIGITSAKICFWRDPYFWIHGFRNKNQFNIYVFLAGWQAARISFRKPVIASTCTFIDECGLPIFFRVYTQNYPKVSASGFGSTLQTYSNVSEIIIIIVNPGATNSIYINKTAITPCTVHHRWR